MARPLRIRQAARAVVMDPDRRVLLVHFDFQVEVLADRARPWDGLWACPGGGLDPGERVEDGLRRELREELGLAVSDVGAPIWLKEHVFPMSRWDGQHDTFYLIEVEKPFDPRPTFSEAELRVEHVDGMLWWEYDELMRGQAAFDSGNRSDPAYTVFSPRALGHLVTELIASGRPADPIQLDPL